MTENLVAVALFRSAASAVIQAAPAPGAIGYWRSSRDREIDFVVPLERSARRLPVEVKGDSASGIGYARSAIKRAFGRGIVLSRSRFDWSDEVAVIPTPVLCRRCRRLRGGGSGRELTLRLLLDPQDLGRDLGLQRQDFAAPSAL